MIQFKIEKLNGLNRGEQRTVTDDQWARMNSRGNARNWKVLSGSKVIEQPAEIKAALKKLQAEAKKRDNEAKQAAASDAKEKKKEN